MKVRVPKQLTALPSSMRATVLEIRKLVRDKRLLIWAFFIILFPFYLFPSGLPQPGDCLLFVLLPMLLVGKRDRMPADLRQPVLLLVGFMLYVVLSNLLWSFVLFKFAANAKRGFLLSPTYYIYNALLFWTFLLMYRRYGLTIIWLTVHLTVFSVSFQVFLSFVTAGHGDRASMFFNNPNQLGYYGLLCACLILLCQRKLKLSTLTMTAGLMACSYLALISASKAALASIAALGIVFVINRVRTMVVAGIVLAVLVFTNNPFSAAIDAAQERIEREQEGQTLTLAEQRGYDRIYNNPEYWLLGSGEGDYQRFSETTAIGAHELHSSMGTLFFCYGTVGTLLFLAFVWRTVKGGGFRVYLVVGPAFAFGMAHQGLRFTLFWVMLAVVAALRNADLAAVPRAAPQPQPVRPWAPRSSLPS